MTNKLVILYPFCNKTVAKKQEKTFLKIFEKFLKKVLTICESSVIFN